MATIREWRAAPRCAGVPPWQEGQGTEFAAMGRTARVLARKKPESAVALLSSLNDAFGDDEGAS